MVFLSEENVLRHKAFLKEMKLKYSVLEKSVPQISGKSIKEISHLHVSCDDKDEILRLKSAILLHEIYFDSFGDNFSKSDVIRKNYGSEAALLYEIESLAMKNSNGGYVLIYNGAKNKPEFAVGSELSDVLIKFTPQLVIDFYEHAYFLDYGFDKKRYLRSALSALRLDKIDEFYKRY